MTPTTPPNEIIPLANERGEPIYCVYNGYGNRPLVVIPPLLAGTCRMNLLSMLYLVRNGFDVCRFDFTHHVGSSFGSQDQFTLSGALADLRAVMALAERWRQSNKVTAVAAVGSSISSRVLLRYLANPRAPAVDVFVSVLGVVDLAWTARVAVDLDVTHLLADPAYRYGRGEVLRVDVDRDPFMQDMAQQDWHDVATTKKEIDRLTVPVYLIVAEQDTWVPLAQVESAYRARPDLVRRSYKILNASHELYRNPRAFKKLGRATTECLRAFFFGDASPLAEPSITDFLDWNTHERQQEAAYSASAGPAVSGAGPPAARSSP